MVRDGLEKFRRAADAAGYDSDERSGMFKRFSGIDDGDTFGRDGSGKFSREVKKNHLLGFFRNFLECSLDPSYRGDWNDLSDLGQILHDFSAEKYLDDEGLNEVSVLIKLVEESFYDGTILKAANAVDSREFVFPMLAFIVNKLTKIQEKYSRRDALARLDQDRMEGFVGDVENFAVSGVSDVLGGEKQDEFKKRVLASKEAIVNDADARKNNTGGLYLIKSTLVAASLLRDARKSGNDERLFLYNMGESQKTVREIADEQLFFSEKFLDKVVATQVQIMSNNKLYYDDSEDGKAFQARCLEIGELRGDRDAEKILGLFGDTLPYTTYDFEEKKFDMESDVFVAGKSGQWQVHVRPEHMMFAAATALYLEQQAGIATNI